MSRRLRLDTRELGPLELFVIYSYNGAWEARWQPIQHDEVAGLFTVVSKEVYDHALLGWTKPFITALGLSPEGALRKLPVAHQQCEARKRCTFYDKKRCLAASPKMPWCYEPGGVEDGEKRRLVAEIIGEWRQGVYVVVVQGDAAP
jgi:hypothetical protein